MLDKKSTCKFNTHIVLYKYKSFTFTQSIEEVVLNEPSLLFYYTNKILAFCLNLWYYKATIKDFINSRKGVTYE